MAEWHGRTGSRVSGLPDASGSSSAGEHVGMPSDGHAATAGVIVTFLGTGALLLLGFGIVSDCTSEPSCASACQDACSTAFHRNWAVASGLLVAVAIVAVATAKRRAPLVIVPATIAAGALLIALR